MRKIGQGYCYLDQQIIPGYIGKVIKLLFHISIASRGSLNLVENMPVNKHGCSKTLNDILNFKYKNTGRCTSGTSFRVLCGINYSP